MPCRSRTRSSSSPVAGTASAARSRSSCSDAARASPRSTSARTGLAETVALAPARAGRLTTHALSVADRAAVEALPDQVIAAHGQVDGILNIAGIIQRFVHVEELSIEEIEKVMAVNFWGTLYMDKTFIPLLKAAPAGRAAQRVEHGRPRAGPRPGRVRREQGRREAADRDAVRRAPRHERRCHRRLPRRRRHQHHRQLRRRGAEHGEGHGERQAAQDHRRRTRRRARSSRRSRRASRACSSAATRRCSTGCRGSAPTKAITTVADQMKKMLGI